MMGVLMMRPSKPDAFVSQIPKKNEAVIKVLVSAWQISNLTAHVTGKYNTFPPTHWGQFFMTNLTIIGLRGLRELMNSFKFVLFYTALHYPISANLKVRSQYLAHISGYSI
jgi:hypothetical protein